jgi:hypothetical protein
MSPKVNPIKISRKKNPPMKMTMFSPLSQRKPIKNNRTKDALIAATTRATIKSSVPRSKRVTTTVIAVRISRLIKVSR